MTISANRLAPEPAAAAAPAAADLTPLVIQRLAAFLKQASGVQIDSSKGYLIESKLRPLLKREGLASFTSLIDILERGTRPALSSDVIQSMTINETHFFRDRIPFQSLRSVVPDLAQRNRQTRSLRIWSAACSTGQEIYSIAMMLDELAGCLAGYTVELIATDISNDVIRKAAKGAFNQFEVQRGLPSPLLLKHFIRQGEDWIISERIRRMVRFKQQNLLGDFAALGRFDVVLCRNVLIYFDPPTRTSILERIGRQMNPEGVLVVGSSESMAGLAAGYASDERAAGLLRYVGRPPSRQRPA